MLKDASLDSSLDLPWSGSPREVYQDVVEAIQNIGWAEARALVSEISDRFERSDSVKILQQLLDRRFR